MSHQLSLSLQPLMELIISSSAHIPHSKMESRKGSIDTYQRNGSCSDVWQPCLPLSSKISGPMLVGVLFHRGLYHHQPPSSVLGDITPYQCLFGSPPDYENIILFLLCLYTCPATSEACTSCKQMFFKGGMPRLRKAFDVLILLLVFDGPASYLPWARVLLLPPTYFSRRLLDQHLLDLLHQWFFLRLPCIRGSQSPKGIRVAALYWAASTCTSLF